MLAFPNGQNDQVGIALALVVVTAAGVGAFRIARPILLRSKGSSVMCPDCGAPFALVKKVTDRLLSSTPRVERTGFGQSGDNGGGWKEMIREKTWVDEIHEVTTDVDCIACKKHSTSMKNEKRSTGFHTSEYRA